MEDYAKYISETTLNWRIPTELDHEGVHYSGDLREKPELLLALGYLPVRDDPDAEVPEEVPGKHLEERFRQTEDAIFRYWILVDDPPRNLSLSKRKLMNHFKNLGIWEQVKAFMQTTNDYWDNWEASTTLDEQEEMMQSAIFALKSAFQMSDEMVEEIISGSAVESNI